MLNKYSTYEINKLFKCVHFRRENATKLISGSEAKKKKFLKSLSVVLIIVLQQFRTILTYVS